MIKAILFDLDGTLLPMDQEIFIKAYFKLLAANLSSHGYNPDELIKAVWSGTEAMIKNNSGELNENVFWKVFSNCYKEDKRKDEPIFAKYYETDFQKAKEVCGFNKKAEELVKAAKNEGFRVVLATNPVFPAIATESRIKWAGLKPSDFEFYTTYENSYSCKPNLKYYKDIIEKLGVLPEECVMIGNDVTEDMIAEELGMKVFLITDSLINKNNDDIEKYPNGNFDDAINYILNLKN